VSLLITPPIKHTEGNPMDLQAIGNNVIVKLSQKGTERVSSGGIIIPDTIENRETCGEIVSIGNTVTDDIKSGDEIRFKKRTGLEFAQNNENYVIILNKDILCTIN